MLNNPTNVNSCHNDDDSMNFEHQSISQITIFMPMAIKNKSSYMTNK